MKCIKLLSCFLWAVSILTSCGPSSQESSESPTSGPDTSNLVKAEAPDAIDKKQEGYILPGMTHGISQSPINIKSSKTEEGMHEIKFHYETSKEKVANLGHTVQVNYDPGSTITFDDTTYAFKQFHFHTPSEHLIDGITYPLEMHMVHVLDGKTVDDSPHYLVVGILFKEGESNPFLDTFINAIPKEEGDINEDDHMSVNINDLITNQEDFKHYYHYKGSLTTPPYTETVNWTVLKRICEASEEQIEKLNKIEGNNARHVQAIYDREVDAS